MTKYNKVQKYTPYVYSCLNPADTSKKHERKDKPNDSSIKIGDENVHGYQD